MATDKKSSGGTSSSGGDGKGPGDKSGSTSPTSSQTGSKRPVTIDLTAEKVAGKTGSASTEGKSASGVPKTGATGSSTSSSSGSKAGTGTKTDKADTKPTSSYSSSRPGTSSSTSKPSSSTAGAGKTGTSASAKTSSTSTTTKPGSSSTSSSSSSAQKTPPKSFSSPPPVEESGGVGAFGVLIAAVIGGILVLGGAFGLHQAGMVKLNAEPNQQVTRALSAAEDKISELESQLADVSKSVTGQNPGAALSALETKVSDLEGKLEAAASADLAPAIEAVKTDLASLRSDMSSISTGEGVPVDLKPLENRLAALEDGAGSSQAVDLTPLEDRVSKLESETNSTTTEATQLSGSVTDLSTELGDLKTSLADVENRLQNTEATAKAAQTAVSTSDVSLKTLADSQARATETLSSLSADIKSVGDANSAALEDIRAELTALSKRLAQVESTMGDATARETAARALSVSALKSAVDSGRPYETELAAVKAGLPSDIDLKALETHAQAGVEPVSVLIAQFPGVARKMFMTFSEPDHSGDVLDSLLASAKSIVTVRGPGDADGSGPEAALRQMENAVSNGNLNDAIAAYDKLPEAAQTAGSDWVARAKARVEVDALTDKASQEVLNALAAKDS